jgi:mannose-1-phosphate guanylyltransferase
MAHAPVGMILSAGFGTRLQPLTNHRPKPVMELFGQPIIYWLIKMLEKASIKDIFLNLHYQPERVVRALDGLDIKARIHFSYEKELLGTAGGLRRVLNRFDIKDRKMLLLHGDILCDVDLNPLLQNHDFCTLLCAKDRQIKGYSGGVGIDKSGSILELGRFYKTDKVSKERGFFTGIHALSPQALNLIKNDEHNDLVGQIYPTWLREGRKLKALMKEIDYEDLGSKERLFAANMKFASSPFYRNSSIHPESLVSTKKIFLPVMIGKNSFISKNAEIGPNVIIGKNCVVKDGATLKNCVVISDTVIEKDERLDCMIGVNGVRVIVER